MLETANYDNEPTLALDGVGADPRDEKVRLLNKALLEALALLEDQAPGMAA